MNRSMAEQILQDRRMAYLVTNRDLIVVEVGGATDVLVEEPGACRGRSLVALVPELIGSEAMLADVLAGELPRLELFFVNRETGDGETTYLTMVDLPHRNAARQIVGIIHLVQDVTEVVVVDQQFFQMSSEVHLLRDRLAQTNRELVAVNAELEQLSDLKSQFIAVAAHELAKPLTPIRGYLEMLLDGDFGPLTGEQRERLEVVARSARRLRSLTTQLLDVNRIEAERVDLVLQPTDLATLVENLVAEVKPQLEAKSQSVALNIPSAFPLALIDETRAAQIITNLLSNASLYTPQGGRIVVSLSPAEQEGFARVSVADNGVGIAAEDRERLFARFFRAGSAIRARAGGAGLGLHIAKSLVELHGGQIWFESEPGRGSTFHVTFPFADGITSQAAAPLTI
jgi:signal transduction histidine kinase